MSRYVQFVTPENIEVSYELAGIGSRFIATLIDHFIQLAIIMALALGSLIFMRGAASIHAVFAGEMALWVEALLILAVFCILFGYFIFFELLWAGRTPGKRLAGLRVVRDGGWPIDPYAAIVRNIVRMVDILPPFYGAGLLSIFFSGEYKRLGDYAAGTLVIKERAPGQFGTRRPGPASPPVAYFMALLKSTDALTAEEFQAVRRFAARRYELAPPIQARIAMRLALPLMQKLNLNVQITHPLQYADLLEAIERRHVEERSLLTDTAFFTPV
jgi:uncharacterized RDD family membrane protein YckC